MSGMLKKIIKYKRLTLKYPKQPMDSSNFIGKPAILKDKCTGCGICENECPTNAIVKNKEGEYGINIDECIFCVRCEDFCPESAIKMTREFELAATGRNDLRHTPIVVSERDLPGDDYEVIGAQLERKIKSIFRRSLNIREVDAGSCNACDYEINALNNPFNDIERFGIHFVASPRHADMLLVTGPASRNMELALVKTYNATPYPKKVIAVGTCAISGGIFKDTYATRNGIGSILPVDVYIPGCPPRPQAILYGIFKALD
jgi:Ni,Fe-hydrogenase III small subunit/ferredoxin